MHRCVALMFYISPPLSGSVPKFALAAIALHCKKTRPSRVVSDHPGVSPRVPWMDGTIQGCLG